MDNNFWYPVMFSFLTHRKTTPFSLYCLLAGLWLSGQSSAANEVIMDVSHANINGTVYVTDALTIPLRSGPTDAYRFIGELSAGTQLKLLAQDLENKSSHVEDLNGKKGWVSSRYLTLSMGASEQLLKANQQLEDLNQKLDLQQLQNKDYQFSMDKLTQHNTTLQEQVSELQNKLEIEQQKYLRLSDNKRFEPFYMGAIVAFVFLIVGLFLGRPKKRGDGWS
ncbi:MAG: hypothetical protein COW84_05230 [Gammaproteobacteria bacterium CG22_combo_CG10-13_8_21_14_all_40_8]|nr:MAG: hypothetical protein COW84_05230 [Gammaproteobacteria bacterium CG22_combo_CG10-13_8_21_14_all_40_8]